VHIYNYFQVWEQLFKYLSFAMFSKQYEYVRSSFSDSNSPSAFIRFIEGFKDLIWSERLLIYLDNLLRATETSKNNLEIIK